MAPITHSRMKKFWTSFSDDDSIEEPVLLFSKSDISIFDLKSERMVLGAIPYRQITDVAFTKIGRGDVDDFSPTAILRVGNTRIRLSIYRANELGQSPKSILVRDQEAFVNLVKGPTK